MGQKGEDEALRLVGLAYDTALGGRDWTGVLEPLAASIGAKSSILRMVDYTRREVGFFDAVGIDPAYRFSRAGVQPAEILDSGVLFSILSHPHERRQLLLSSPARRLE